jgi:pimeloyl-ACP methyl ester carboxylesterase
VRFARENGARSVILESPILDWVSTIKATCARSGLPAWTGVLAVPWLTCQPLARLIGLGKPVRLRRFNWVARASEIAVPMLVLHGLADTSSPFAVSVRVERLRPDVVHLELFDADHTMTWNSDCERWRAVLSSWLASRSVAG